ncbi:MAG: glycosyltransferase family 8 protein [Paraprevotella sp.]|nr:glycosyltransferase family 8 protein [Paraprevotella sp.]
MIHIACNIDSRYVRHCAVTLVSLFENNKTSDFTVHLIADRLPEDMKAALTCFCQSYSHRIAFYSPDPELLNGFTIRKFSKRISMATYYRGILSDLLPVSVDRLLYLDCDIVVLGDIRPFWETPLDHIGVAAVEDIGCREKQRYDILQYPMEYSYFNAGVLLINLDYWRQHDVARACVDYFHAHPERILFNDQDLLNSILYRHKTLVDLRWNVQDGFYRNPGHMTEEWRKKYADALLHPVILHYTNRKPWVYDSQHPLRDQYFKYLDLTPWKDMRPDRSVGNRLKRFFRLCPFYVGLRRPKYVQLDKI